MRIRMAVADTVAGLVHDVVVATTGSSAAADMEADVRFAAVRPELAALVGDPEARFTVEGRPIHDDDLVGEGVLLRGAVVCTAPAAGAGAAGREAAPPSATDSGSLVELHVVGGPGAGRIISLRRGRHVLGRATSCEIRLDDHGVSRAHASITVDDAGVTLRDLESTNPTSVDGKPVPAGGLALAFDQRVRVASTTVVLRRADGTPAAADCTHGIIRINRRPRFAPSPRAATVHFPTRPTRPQAARAPVVAAVAPLLISLALAVALRSPVMMLFALMSPLMLLAQWWGDRRHGRVSYRSQLARHAHATAEAAKRLDEALLAERRSRHLEQPDLALVAAVARHHEARLWERRPGDRDHLVLRVGTAEQVARTRVERPRDTSEDPGSESVADPTVPDVPVVIDANTGVVGVAGPRPRARALVSALVAQAAVWHSPRTTQVVLISASTDAATEWGWASWLPHAEGSPNGPVAKVASTADESTVAARLAELQAVIRSRAEQSATVSEGEPAVPRYLVVLDGTAELRRRPGVAAVLEAPPAAGVHVIGLDDSPERLPAECRTQILLDEGPAPRAELHHPDGTIRDIIPDLPHPTWFAALSRALAPLEDATPGEGSEAVPDAIGIRRAHRLVGLEPTNPSDLAKSWFGSDGRPRAVLGATGDGPYVVDLAQDGPHCLVGGTTGSGKSELLQSLVAGLAVGSPPDQLTFVLVDYKGGSAFKECAHLPHCLGIVTDLDEHLTRRALESLGAELKRRETLLAEAGAKDLDDYRRARTSRPDLEQIARLVIVVDEFKMLADELPDFVDGLVRIAAVGRSLGVHLVLATQRPAGIITGDMRANISLRIALRVRDRSDSDDVIESPLAAAISDRTPGRAVVRTAGGRLTEVQTAFAGASTGADEHHRPQQVTVRRLSWTDLGRPLPAAHPPASGNGATELQAVVLAAQQAAASSGLSAPPSPWLPPLPDRLSRASLPAGSRAAGVALGMADRPATQSQDPYLWDPSADGNLAVAGGARTGRTTAARSLALGLAELWPASHLHLHVIEGTPGALRDLAALPHVGSVTSTADPALAARVVSRLAESMGRPPEDREKVVTVLVVDGWEAVEDAFEAVDHGAPTEMLLRLARDGLASGLRLVLTGGRALVTGRISSLVQRRLVLPMPDPLDLTLAGLPPEQAQGHRGVGRAIDVLTGHHVQIAHVGADPSPAGQEAATAHVAERLRASHAAEGVDPGTLPWRVTSLPRTVSWNDLPPSRPGRLLLGLGGDDARPVGFDAEQVGRRVVVVGGPRSGRSTVLAVMARRLAEAGRPTALVATRRTPLSWLSAVPDVHLVSAHDSDQLRRLHQVHPGLSVLVDDAEGLDGSPAERVVLDVAQQLDETGAWCAAAVDARRAPGLYRGVVPDLARHGTGVVLSPTSPSDGDLLGIRADVAQHRVPGRGLIVLDGVALPLQVADPGLLPAPRPSQEIGPAT